MKKLLLTTFLAGVAAASFGQGTVIFKNYNAANPAIDAPVTYKETGLKVSGTQGRIALIAGPANGAIAASANTLGNLSMTFYATTTANSTISWVNFGTGTTKVGDGYAKVGSSSGRTVLGVDFGGSAGVAQLVAWTGNYNTWADAWAAAQTDNTVLIGASSLISFVTAGASTSPSQPYLAGLTGFTIASVPEPSSMALAGLGAAALLIFRRRK